MAEMEARLMSVINHVEEWVWVHYDAPLVEMNQKINTLIAMLQNWDIMVMKILHVPDDNVLKHVDRKSTRLNSSHT